jgi:hypothetical protein
MLTMNECNDCGSEGNLQDPSPREIMGPILWDGAISLPLESHGKAPPGNFAAERRFVGEGLGLGIHEYPVISQRVFQLLGNEKRGPIPPFLEKP